MRSGNASFQTARPTRGSRAVSTHRPTGEQERGATISLRRFISDEFHMPRAVFDQLHQMFIGVKGFQDKKRGEARGWSRHAHPALALEGPLASLHPHDGASFIGGVIEGLETNHCCCLECVWELLRTGAGLTSECCTSIGRVDPAGWRERDCSRQHATRRYRARQAYNTLLYTQQT